MQDEILKRIRNEGSDFMEPVVLRQLELIKLGTPVDHANVVALSEVLEKDPSLGEKLKNI